MKEKNSAVNEGKLPSHGWRGPLGEELIQWRLRDEHELVENWYEGWGAVQAKCEDPKARISFVDLRMCELEWPTHCELGMEIREQIESGVYRSK